MKKVFIAAAATLLTAAATFAQNAPAAAPATKPAATTAPAKVAPVKMAKAPTAAAPAAKPQAAAPQKMADAATRAQKMANQLTKSLSLDAATSQKVLAAATTRCQKVDEIYKTITDTKARDKAFKDNAEAYKTALKGILTPAQFTQIEQSKGKGKKGGKAESEDK